MSIDNPWKLERTGRPHCLDRARERYGIELTIAELKELTRRCRQGEGVQKNAPHMKTGARAHMICFADKVVDCVWRPPNGDHNVDGFIVTILPAGTIARGVSWNDGKNTIKRAGSGRRAAKW